MVVLAGFSLTGCAISPSGTRVDFGRTEINGQPVHFQLDTGSPSLVIYNSSARRLGIKYAENSEPVKVSVNDQNFTAPLPIFRLPWKFRALGVTEGEDGLIGWPEIRDNILVFDGDQKIICRVEKLPPETGQWTKLRIVPSRWLLLETPLANGKQGVMLVDTGAPLSIEMAEPQWRAWKNEHRDAQFTWHRGAGYSFGAFKFQSAWAEEVRMGSMALSGLEVESMPEEETRFLQKAAPRASAIWAIGMYALRRMDLVVDWKGGFAYMRQKPKAVPTGGGGNWLVARNVHLRSDNLFALAGEDDWNKKKFDAAVSNYNRALEINPDNAEAYADRGDVEALRGDEAAAISDYGRALRLNPESADTYSGRAVARELVDDLSGAAMDYSKAIELRPDDSFYEQLFRELLLRRLNQPGKDFFKTVASWTNGWTKSIGLYLAGRLEEESLLAAAKKKDLEPASGQKCEAYYYMGVMRLENGNKDGAREAFEKCRVVGAKEFSDYAEYQLAGLELKHLDTSAK